MSLVHGGNVYEVASQLGCAPEHILDYSASINPLGPPPGLWEALSAVFNRVQHYPDIRNSSLLEKLAGYHGLPSDMITVGNGSTELIYLLPRALRIHKAVVVLPTFSEYGKAFDLQGVELHKLITSPDANFQPTVEQLDAVCRKVSPEAILFTNPGSPAGTLFQPAVREWIVQKSRHNRFFCLVDEVFADFCEQESLKTFIESSPGLVLIRSMTKFYGIPGLRLGYLLTSGGVAAEVRNLVPPWSVNTLAQIAGSYSFDQRAYREETLRLVESERNWLTSELKDLKAFQVFPGRANYLLMKLDHGLPSAAVLCRDLIASDRILIRDCSSFEGLDDRYVRVAIRLPEENRRLLGCLRRWIGSRGNLGIGLCT
jgi:threonine-phosphate decarboxylase